MSEPISVLMSLYKKEDPKALSSCLDSILNQTLLPNEILVVIDGPITNQLQQVLDQYGEKTRLLRLLPQAQNQGLGLSLALGVRACAFELIARMDTDDIMNPDRLKIQAETFERTPTLGICGSNITEFDGSLSNVVGHRNVPQSPKEIYNFAKRRNPFNHMSVMYRRSEVLAAGNYMPLQGFEDYYLWVRMLKNGTKGFNIQQSLVYARTGAEMYARRGGWSYLVTGIKGRYQIYRVGIAKFSDFVFVMGVHIVVSLMPNRLRGWFYNKTIHA